MVHVHTFAVVNCLKAATARSARNQGLVEADGQKELFAGSAADSIRVHFLFKVAGLLTTVGVRTFEDHSDSFGVADCTLPYCLWHGPSLLSETLYATRLKSQAIILVLGHRSCGVSSLTVHCIFCGEYLNPSEHETLEKTNGLQAVRSLKQKLFQQTDKVLRSYVIHHAEAESLLVKGNGFHKGRRLLPSRHAFIQTTYGVLNRKIYVNDLPHCPCGSPMLSTGQVKRLLGILPAQRCPIDAETRSAVLARWHFACGRDLPPVFGPVIS